MDESFKCECGNENFWAFKKNIRCNKCFNEYRFEKLGFTGVEVFVSKFIKEENKYSSWESLKTL